MTILKTVKRAQLGKINAPLCSKFLFKISDFQKPEFSFPSGVPAWKCSAFFILFRRYCLQERKRIVTTFIINKLAGLFMARAGSGCGGIAFSRNTDGNNIIFDIFLGFYLFPSPPRVHTINQRTRRWRLSKTDAYPRAKSLIKYVPDVWVAQ